MLEILHFVFSSFWVWLGCFLMIAAIGAVIANFIQVLRSK